MKDTEFPGIKQFKSDADDDKVEAMMNGLGNGIPADKKKCAVIKNYLNRNQHSQ